MEHGRETWHSFCIFLLVAGLHYWWGIKSIKTKTSGFNFIVSSNVEVPLKLIFGPLGQYTIQSWVHNAIRLEFDRIYGKLVDCSPPRQWHSRDCEPGNHIPSKLLHSLLLHGGEKPEGRGRAWWVENFASWWELGSPRRVLQTINHSIGFKGLVAKFYCYYDASLKPRWDTWWVEIPPGAISSDGSPPLQGRDSHLPPPPPGVIRPSLISHAPNTPIRHPLVTDNFKSATATNATDIAGMKIGHCKLL